MVPSIGSMIQRSSAFWPFASPASSIRNQSRGAPSTVPPADLLGTAVGLGHEVAGAFARCLELLDLAEVADQAPRRFRCGVHDTISGVGNDMSATIFRLACRAAPARFKLQCGTSSSPGHP